MTGAGGRSGDGSEVRGSKDAPLDRRSVSPQAYKALQTHAAMFKASGADLLEDDGRTISLSDRSFGMSLDYRSQRKLLARIDHLRIKAEFVASGPKAAASFKLRLQRAGPLGGEYEFTLTGRDSAQAEKVGRDLLRSGIVQELASKVDLEDLSISRCPKRGVWELVLEPYPGCHVSTVFPPARYTVRLKNREIEAVREFLARASKVLGESGKAQDERVSSLK